MTLRTASILRRIDIARSPNVRALFQATWMDRRKRDRQKARCLRSGSIGTEGLVDDLDGHLHARVNRADDRNIAGFLEADIGGATGRLRAQIELVALACGHDVVGDGVIVEEGQGFALLQGDALLREHTPLLMDHLHGGKSTGGKPGNDGNTKNVSVTKHGLPLN